MVIDDTEKVVLRVYDDKLVYAELDSTGAVSNKFGVVQIDGDPLDATYKDIGYLKPADD